jgi:hypothetical protein
MATVATPDVVASALNKLSLDGAGVRAHAGAGGWRRAGQSKTRAAAARLSAPVSPRRASVAPPHWEIPSVALTPHPTQPRRQATAPPPPPSWPPP